MALEALLERFKAGQRGALARLLTYVENDHPHAGAVLEALYSNTGNARVIGITGPPGAGKSTLTNALIGAYRGRGETVAVLAIDPSSSVSGGAALGDRIRMLDTYDDDGVYIRSMATRGQYGGLALAAERAIHLLDAFGFDVIILETVGVGQAEVDVVDVADTTLLLQVPGLGDSVQTIKAGILEVADIIVVNKSDLPDARVLVRDLRTMLRYREHAEWTTPVVPVTATTGEGIGELIEAIDRHETFLAQTPEGQERLRERSRREVQRLAQRALSVRIDNVVTGPVGVGLIEDVYERRISPQAAAEQIVSEALSPEACVSLREHIS